MNRNEQKPTHTASWAHLHSPGHHRRTSERSHLQQPEGALPVKAWHCKRVCWREIAKVRLPGCTFFSWAIVNGKATLTCQNLSVAGPYSTSYKLVPKLYVRRDAATLHLFYSFHAKPAQFELLWLAIILALLAFSTDPKSTDIHPISLCPAKLCAKVQRHRPSWGGSPTRWEQARRRRFPSTMQQSAAMTQKKFSECWWFVFASFCRFYLFLSRDVAGTSSLVIHHKAWWSMQCEHKRMACSQKPAKGEEWKREEKRWKQYTSRSAAI